MSVLHSMLGLSMYWEEGGVGAGKKVLLGLSYKMSQRGGNCWLLPGERAR